MRMFICEYCNCKFTDSRNPNRRFCSNQCQKDHEFDIRYERWLNGTEIVIVAWTSTFLRRAVIRRDGYRCKECGISEWCGKPISLELEHKNGVGGDNRPHNLCLLCPNCHSQTPTFRAKNKGKGRFARRDRDRRNAQIRATMA